jgi:hypothetical protein
MYLIVYQKQLFPYRSFSKIARFDSLQIDTSRPLQSTSDLSIVVNKTHQGRRNPGSQVPPPKFSEDTKSALSPVAKCQIPNRGVVMKSALFVQANVAVNTILTSKVPFLFPEHIYVCPFTQPNYVVNTNLRHVSKSNKRKL